MNTSLSNPLVTIIVTTKNNSDTLEKCLVSIQDQTYPSTELIVVDNNSTDNTKKIARKYTSAVYNKGPERSTQRNYAVQLSKGDYIIIIDSDMILSKTVVSDCMGAVSKTQQAITIPEESFGQGFWAQCKALERSFYNGVEWIEAPRFFAKELFLIAGGYDEDIVGGEDWDLRNRISPLTKIGHSRNGILHDEGRLTIREIIKSRKYYAQGFKKHYDKPKDKTHKSGAAQAISIYVLILNQPRRLFRRPLLGIGVLLMKFIEFTTIYFYSRSKT